MIEVEKEVIGACLTYEKCLAVAVQELEPKHFQYYAPVFSAIKWFYREGRDFDNILFDVKEKLEGKINKSTYYQFVDYAVPSITDRVKELVEKWTRKRLKEISDTIYSIDPDEPFRDKTISAIHDLSDLLSGNQKREQVMSEVMDETIELIETLRAGESLGMKCGLDIDKILHGFQKGLFYILAARPSMGKTALAVQIAQEISKRHPVAFLSLETTNKSLGMRNLANFAEIDGDRIRSGKVSDEEFEALKNNARRLSKLPIILDDTTDVSSEGIRAKVNTMKRKHNIEFLIIDYVQLMRSDRDYREQQVADISRACVGVAKEFDICVLGLAQLNRECEKRTDKRPILSDLRESGQLEQDAFCVMFLNRPEHYGIKLYPNGDSTENIAEIIVAKQKDGKTGIKKQIFEKSIMKFRNLQDNMPF